MIQEFNDLAERIRNKEIQLNKIKNESNKIDADRLEEVINITKDVIHYEPVWSNKEQTVQENETKPAVKYDYLLISNRQVEGIKIKEFRTSIYEKLDFCDKIDAYELWLLKNEGFVVLKVTGCKERVPGGKISIQKELYIKDYDIFNVKSKFQWNVDDIISAIKDNLIQYCNDLEEQIKTNNYRLQELKKIEIGEEVQ